MLSGEGEYLTSKDGTRIWADASGDPSKPQVVFIHGLSCTALAFEKQFSDPQLLESLYMVRYEMRGHGRSDQPENFESYASIRYAEDFMTVCEAYNLKKPFICGWSLGGVIVVDVVDAYGAETISGVVFAGGPVLTRNLHSEYIHPYLQSHMASFLSSSGDVLAKVALIFVDSCVKNPEELPFDTKIKWLGGFLMQSPTVRTHTLTRTQNTERWAKEIKDIPVLIIQGSDDLHSHTEKLAETAKKCLGNYEFKVIDGVGHAPCYERPAETNAYILEFVQKVAGQK